MRLLIISNLYPPIMQGGAEVVAERMAEGLRGSLQHVAVLSTMPYRSWRSLSARQYEHGGAMVYRFFPLNIYHYTDGFRFPWAVRAIWHCIDIFNLHSAWQVARVIRTERPDAVITHNLMGLGFLTPLVIAYAKIRHVHILHDVQLLNPSGLILKDGERSIGNRLYGVIGYRALMRFLFKRTSVIVSPSRFLLDVYKRFNFFSDQRTVVIPNPVPIPGTFPQGMQSPELRLLYVGQVSQAKGVVGLVKSVLESPSHVRLAVVGNGLDLQKCLRLAGNDKRITFFGWQSHRFVLGLFGATDVVIAPTMCYDNSPTIVFEALSYSVPVIASDLGGASEVVKNGRNGWLFEAGDWKQLSAVIMSLSNDREQLLRTAAQARSSVAEFSPERYTQQILTLCQNDRP